MSFSNEELKKLALPLVVLVALLAAGAALVWWAQREQRLATQNLAQARAERTQANERLARIAEEEKEVNDKLEVYRRLKSAGILGGEQRLEWADAMTRIRTQRELLDLRYTVGRQQPVSSVAGKPNSVDFFSSTMRVDIALLHEGDLFTFLRDLRESGNAYYAVKRCGLARTSGFSGGAASIAPRLRADCDIDLITIIDRAAKT